MAISAADTATRGEVVPADNEIDIDIERELRWARRTAARYGRLGTHQEGQEDLLAEMMLGLAEALRRYEPQQGVAFSYFARRRMIGALRDELRRRDPLTRAERQAWRQHNRTTANANSATPSSLPLAFKRRILQKLTARSQERTQGGQDISQALPCPSPSPEQQVAHREVRRALKRCLGELSPRQRQIMHLLYVEEMTTVEAARQIGVSQGRISQIRSACIQQLREKLEACA